ncbi:LysR family transcriptional regulator [Roseateles cellulosilyticus]|uniref:helix-turn-helix domain-containing protein n=1 Tax=Pelomonas cellulosilytica TaxID=2906762 RepID=UPI0032C2214F
MDHLLAIRALERAIEPDTFTRAADSLNMPNPNAIAIAIASKLIRDVEGHLGVRLLQRTTRRMTVTWRVPHSRLADSVKSF